MSTSRKIQIALVASLLWSCASVSSFAATNAVNPGKNQSFTEKIPVESIPVRQLNLTPDSNLIAGKIRDQLGQIPKIESTFSTWDDIWKTPTDRQKRLFDYCNTQKDFTVQQCFSFLQVWVVDAMDTVRSARDFDDRRNILEAIFAMRKSTNP